MEKPVFELEIKAEIKGVASVEDNISLVKEHALKLDTYYKGLIFTEDQIKEAKAERAEVNKTTKKVAAYRKDIITEFKKPIELFEKEAKETEKILKEVSNTIDTQIKTFEDKEKKEKKEQIKNIYEEQTKELDYIITFENIFDDKWLNKTTSIEKVEVEVIDKLDKIRKDIEAIDKLESNYRVELISHYINTFDLSSTIFKNNELKENDEKVAALTNEKEVIKEQKIETIINEKVEVEALEENMTYTLKITGTKNQLKQLKQFLEMQNMRYEKVGD